jgi:protein-S-isoprenylcysteine O-methyltransferase Ste14
MKTLSMAAFIVLVAMIMALFYQKSLLASGVIAIAVQILAVLLMIWARLTFGLRSFHATANPTEGKLVTHGPYRFVRHPIYAAIFYFLWAGVLTHLSVTSGLIAVLACLALGVRVYAEETLLVRQYPDYVEYAARTRRIIPYIL